MTLQKCKNEFCNNVITSQYPEAECCDNCYMEILSILPIFHQPESLMPYKKSWEIRANPRICKMRLCKNKVLVRGMCRKCYLEYMTKK
ncbi:hypothetical protein J2W97_001212 [Paenibacillus jamilae]|nr:hypothetical protein [Paenibacillus jamilae]